MIISYALTLLGVCGLAVGFLVLLRAAKSGGLSLVATQPIRIVARQTVGTGSTLMLVEVDGDRILIGVSRAGILLLADKSAAPSNVVPIESGFRATLRRAGERW